ncbi:hypothetical protein M3Y99_00692900 [Aphelenchoides fujianensis]|nr:hypothetical protein M3Y99_00692900 [Aphelenchoides fujianensis]
MDAEEEADRVFYGPSLPPAAPVEVVTISDDDDEDERPPAADGEESMEEGEIRTDSTLFASSTCSSRSESPGPSRAPSRTVANQLDFESIRQTQVSPLPRRRGRSTKRPPPHIAHDLERTVGDARRAEYNESDLGERMADSRRSSKERRRIGSVSPDQTKSTIPDHRFSDFPTIPPPPAPPIDLPKPKPKLRIPAASVMFKSLNAQVKQQEAAMRGLPPVRETRVAFTIHAKAKSPTIRADIRNPLQTSGDGEEGVEAVEPAEADAPEVHHSPSPSCSASSNNRETTANGEETATSAEVEPLPVPPPLLPTPPMPVEVAPCPPPPPPPPPEQLVAESPQAAEAKKADEDEHPLVRLSIKPPPKVLRFDLSSGGMPPFAVPPPPPAYVPPIVQHSAHGMLSFVAPPPSFLGVPPPLYPPASSFASSSTAFSPMSAQSMLAASMPVCPLPTITLKPLPLPPARPPAFPVMPAYVLSPLPSREASPAAVELANEVLAPPPAPPQLPVADNPPRPVVHHWLTNAACKLLLLRLPTARWTEEPTELDGFMCRSFECLSADERPKSHVVCFAKRDDERLPVQLEMHTWNCRSFLQVARALWQLGSDRSGKVVIVARENERVTVLPMDSEYFVVI